MLIRTSLFFWFLIPSVALCADKVQESYSPSRVAYDFSSSDPVALKNILDRISMLQNVYDNNPFEASIVVVVHEGAIPLFAKNKKLGKVNEYADLMQRAKSLTQAEIIEFKICEASAKMQGFGVADLPGFTRMVPMADAELVKLQQAGYAYLH